MKSSCASKTGLFVGVIACLLLAGKVAKADFIFGEPMMVPNVNGESSDSRVQISRNGLELYMTSTREGGIHKLWYSKRVTTKDAWSTPTPVVAPMNLTAGQEFPSLSADGLELYYADGMNNTADPGGFSKSDIWVLTRASISDPWEAPRNLGSLINSENIESSPCISADGLELYFVSDIQNDPRNSEILVTTRSSKDDPWGEPVALNTHVNSDQYEYTPFISTDGLSLFFSRGFSKSHIHVSRRASATDPWGPAQFLAPVNSGNAGMVWMNSGGYAEYAACFADNESRIYFARGGSAFALDYNIWQVDVIPIVDLNNDGSVDELDAYDLLDNWGPTENSLYDIAPLPLGDGTVDAKDLAVLAEHILANQQNIDADDPTPDR